MRDKVGLAMACFVFSGLLVGPGSAGWAATTADGVTLLTQPANSCTGFPLKLTKTGSYKLFSNLTVSCPDRDAIDVSAAGLVTVDLNGLSIIGPGSGAGVGIKGDGTGSLVVRNGAVTAMGSGIISVLKPPTKNVCKVEEVHLLFNVGTAIECGDQGLILNNTVLNNGTGIDVNTGVVQGNNVVANQLLGIKCGLGLVQNNQVGANGFTSGSPNGSPAIQVGSATVTENTVFGNGGDGIQVTFLSKVTENLVAFNAGDGIDVAGGALLGSNVIGNTASRNSGFGIRFPDAKSAFSSNLVNRNNDLGAACATTLNCNSQVCGGTSPISATSNVCDGMQG